MNVKNKATYITFVLKALCGVLVDIPTLTNEKIPVNLANEIVKPSTVKRIPGYGLPYPKVRLWMEAIKSIAVGSSCLLATTIKKSNQVG